MVKLKIDLSIIIVTYNGREITLKTLEFYRRAIASDPKHSYELIIVDNASSDGVDDAVAREYSEAKLVRNPENLGFSKGNNIGVEQSRGRYLLFSNPDIEVNPETLPTLIELMDQNPKVGACTPFLELVKTGKVDWGAHRGFPTPWAAFTYFSGLAKLFKHSKALSRIFGQYHLLDRDLTREHEVDAIRGGFFFVRREVFEGVGKWDEDYFMYGEDLDLSYQIKKLGYKIMFYPQARARHYHGMTTGLKKHSQGLSEINRGAQDRAFNAFYDTMKIFYENNYADKYPRLVKQLVFLAVDIKKKLGARRKTV